MKLAGLFRKRSEATRQGQIEKISRATDALLRFRGSRGTDLDLVALRSALEPLHLTLEDLRGLSLGIPRTPGTTGQKLERARALLLELGQRQQERDTLSR